RLSITGLGAICATCRARRGRFDADTPYRVPLSGRARLRGGGCVEWRGSAGDIEDRPAGRDHHRPTDAKNGWQSTDRQVESFAEDGEDPDRGIERQRLAER